MRGIANLLKSTMNPNLDRFAETTYGVSGNSSVAIVSSTNDLARIGTALLVRATQAPNSRKRTQICVGSWKGLSADVSGVMVSVDESLAYPVFQDTCIFALSPEISW